MQSLRIYIVEDEERSRRGLADLITSLMPQALMVGQAADGRQALYDIQRLCPDLVFTDIRMPVMDGLALVRAIHERMPDYPVNFVIISAYANFTFAKTAIALGVREYIVKPVDAEAVQDILQRLSQEKCLQHAAAAVPVPQPASPAPDPDQTIAAGPDQAVAASPDQALNSPPPRVAVRPTAPAGKATPGPASAKTCIQPFAALCRLLPGNMPSRSAWKTWPSNCT